MAGAGYKLFQTGAVLTAAEVNTYLQEQAIMRFANATARTTALSGVLAEGMVSYLDDVNQVQVYNGSAWVNVGDGGDITAVTAGTGISGGGTSGAVTITNSMATEITAKGDLIVGTGNATFDNLAAGANGLSLVADSTTTTGLRWQADWNVGKNKIINGDFGIWQRGTSFTVTGAGTYTADRFIQYFDGSGGTTTVSRQTFTPGTAPVVGYEGKFFYRFDRSVGVTSPSFLAILAQRVEDVQTLAGQTATISFWAKANASRTLSVELFQNFGSGGSSQVYTNVGTVTLGTSWTRYTLTLNVPSISGKTIGTSSYLLLEFGSGTLTGTFTVDMWGVQLEAGSVATPFTTATGNPASELAACQRYYYQMYLANSQDTSAPVARTSSTNANWTVYLPVCMRTSPTIVNTAVGGVLGRLVAYDTSFGVTVVNVTDIGITGNYNNQAISLQATNATMTAAASAVSAHFDNANVASSLAFTAEL